MLLHHKQVCLFITVYFTAFQGLLDNLLKVLIIDFAFFTSYFLKTNSIIGTVCDLCVRVSRVKFHMPDDLVISCPVLAMWK